MKVSNVRNAIALVLISLLISSCSAVAGVFKAGMDFGILIVLAVIVIIVGVIVRLKKRS